MIERRAFIRGVVASLFAAPAIVRFESIMPVKAFEVSTGNLLISLPWTDPHILEMERLRDFLLVTSRYYRWPEVDWANCDD